MSNPRIAPLVLAQGDPAPQYWNKRTGQFEVTHGDYGAYLARNVGMTCVASQKRTGSYTFNLTEQANGFSIENLGNTEISFTIDSVTIYLGPAGLWSSLFKPFTSVQVTATGQWQGAVFE